MSKIHVKTVRGTERLRRAGHAFGREAIELDTAKLTKEQHAAIRDEPLLEIAEPEADAGDDKKATGKKTGK